MAPNADSTALPLSAAPAKGFRDYDFRQEGFFAGSPYFRPELGVSHGGVLGDPVPYRASHDDIVTGLLLGILVVGLLAFSGSASFAVRQFKLFFGSKIHKAANVEVSRELFCQWVLCTLSALLMGIFCFLCIHDRLDIDRFPLCEPLVIGSFFGIFLLYFMLKYLLYNIVNWTFFNSKKSGQWNKVWLFLTTSEGLLLLPVILLSIFHHITMKTALFAILFVDVFFRILAFYKGRTIFFREKWLCLQFFLYFCALELTPAGYLWGALALSSNYLIINF